jgi:uncharacterized Tic20 family protein
MNITDELKKLQDLHQSGGLTDEEYARAKDAILRAAVSVPPPPPAAPLPYMPPPLTPEARELQTRQWAMFIHLGQLAGFVLPFAGLVLPIVLWQVKKSELPGVDVHGKIVCNWIISELLYGIVGGVLCLACGLGLLILIPLGIAAIVFPIIGGIKANEGAVWPYPLSIKWVK